MRLTSILPLAVLGLATIGATFPVAINDAVALSIREADALPAPPIEPTPPAKREADALPALPIDPKPPAKREADALPEPQRPARREADALPEPQRPAKREAKPEPAAVMAH